MTLHCQYLKKKSKTKGMMWSSWMSSIIGGVAARRSLRVGKGGEEHRTWGVPGDSRMDEKRGYDASWPLVWQW